MASREELLQSIWPEMRLDRGFFLKIYGYGVTKPDFINEALQALEAVGCSRASQYYDIVISEYERKRDAELRPVARAYREKCEMEWKRRLQEAERGRGWKQEDLHLMSSADLIASLENLLGVI